MTIFQDEKMLKRQLKTLVGQPFAPLEGLCDLSFADVADLLDFAPTKSDLFEAENKKGSMVALTLLLVTPSVDSLHTSILEGLDKLNDLILANTIDFGVVTISQDTPWTLSGFAQRRNHTLIRFLSAYRLNSLTSIGDPTRGGILAYLRGEHRLLPTCAILVRHDSLATEIVEAWPVFSRRSPSLPESIYSLRNNGDTALVRGGGQRRTDDAQYVDGSTAGTGSDCSGSEEYGLLANRGWFLKSRWIMGCLKAVLEEEASF